MSVIATLRTRRRDLSRVGGVYGEMLAEFFGTFIMIAIGCGSIAMAVVALPGSGRTSGSTVIFEGAGDWLIIVWGWAFAVAFAVYVAGGVSGAHLNPAVTLALAVRRGFPWRKVPGHWAAQVLGAFTGAALVYAVYHDAIHAFEVASETPRSSGSAVTTYSIFGTFPAGYFHSWTGPFLDQLVGTALLIILIFALIDSRLRLITAPLAPLLIGFVVAAIGLAFGANAGYAVNPARDLGPRIFTYLAGWGDVALPGSMDAGGLQFQNYMWVPIVAPLVGGVLGAFLYDFFIGDSVHMRSLAAADESVDERPQRAEEG